MAQAAWILALQRRAIETIEALLQKLHSDDEAARHADAALSLLRPQPTVQDLVRAYDLVRLARECGADSHIVVCEEFRVATLMLREALAFHARARHAESYGLGRLDSAAFNRALRDIFLRPVSRDTALISEFSHSYRTICDMGELRDDRAKFDEKAAKIFHGLSSEDLNAMFTAYADCARDSSYVSKQALKGPRKGKRQKRQSPDVPSAAGNLGTPRRVTIKSSRHHDGAISDDEIDCFKKTPLPLEDAAVPEDDLMRCDRCDEWDINTQRYWKTRELLCPGCMTRDNHLRSPVTTEMANPSFILGGPGGQPHFYDHTQLPRLPVKIQRQTQISVEQVCCIEEARRACRAAAGANKRIGVLVHGHPCGPTIEQKHRQSKDVCAASSLQQAFRKGDKRPVPPKGGIAVDDVCLRDEWGSFDPRLRVGMVYAAAAKSPENESAEAQQRYLAEMREKVRNVLRIMRMRLYDELILGAWGCGEFLKAPPSSMARIFREVLEEEEMAGYFSTVTFAVGSQVCAASRAFEAEFAQV